MSINLKNSKLGPDLTSTCNIVHIELKSFVASFMKIRLKSVTICKLNLKAQCTLEHYDR